MANTLQWHDLSLKQINQFYDTNMQQNAINLIESWFPSDDSIIKKRILYDFYYFVLMFAKEINLEPIQISIFFSIMKKTHEICISSPYMKLDEDYASFQKLILTHSIDRPPFSKKYFSLEQITKITEYATNTYFRHYTMYKYTFTKQQKLTLNTIEIGNESEKLEEQKTNENDDEINQHKNEELVDGEEINNNISVSILETEKNENEKESSQKEIEENKTEQTINLENTENVENTENIVDNGNIENETEEIKKEEEEEKEEEKEELTQREKAILDLKALIENAIGPKIQELKTTLTTMLSNSEDQLIKQIKKMDDAKKKAAKEATNVKKDKKDKKGEKENNKKSSAKGKK